VRRAAAEKVGLFDEEFFLFSEETDWCYRFREAGWKVLFYPGAEVVHVGGASHGGRMFRENVRGHLRFLAKHSWPRPGARARPPPPAGCSSWERACAVSSSAASGARRTVTRPAGWPLAARARS
jgi:hypothetical protein